MLLIFSSLLRPGAGPGPTAWPVAANWLLTATHAPLVGHFNPVAPDSREPFTLDFASQIPAGDSLVSADASSLVADAGSDPNAAYLLWGAASISGTFVTQWGGPGWVRGVTYLLGLTARTAFGAVIPLYAHIDCQSIN